MTQSGDPLENPIAERANGILKTEWLYKMKIATREECSSVLERIIIFYNNERPHMNIEILLKAFNIHLFSIDYLFFLCKVSIFANNLQKLMLQFNLLRI